MSEKSAVFQPLTDQYSAYNPKGVKAALPPDQPLSAQQMQALAKSHAEQLAAIKRDVELRKWAVDQACGLAGAAYDSETHTVDAIALSRDIHAFLTEGATETKT